MDRKDLITDKCDLNGKGLEIGPSLNPVVPKRDGYDVETIDHTDKKGLQEKYLQQGLDISNIEEVDYIWNGKPYTELTGKTDYYNYIIASHVIEHTNDLISFFRDCSALLKENGVLSLVIPDKRYCFDYLRPVTSISQVLDSHINHSDFHKPGSVYEHVSTACRSMGDIAWVHPAPPVDLEFVHSIETAVNMYNKALEQTEYIDIHNWAFTKNSFLQLIYDLNCLGLVDLQVIKSFDTAGHEFYVSLKKRKEKFLPDENERLKLALETQNDLEPADRDAYMIEQINGLNSYIKELKQQINTLNEHISEIYNSRTWKTGEKLQKIYRFFIKSNTKRQD